MLNNSEKGVSLIITFFIMIIILAVVLSVSALLYGEVKLIRNMGNSVAAFYAADSGIEKILYYDRQVYDEEVAKRGLCSIFTNCISDSAPSSIGEHSIYCNDPTPSSFIGTCAPDNCTDCSITFNTVFDGRNYFVAANISTITDPVTGKKSSNFEIKSRGVFNGAQRQIEAFGVSQQP